MKKQQNSKATGQQKPTPTTNKKKYYLRRVRAAADKMHKQNESNARERLYIVLYVIFIIVLDPTDARLRTEHIFSHYSLKSGFCCQRRTSNCVHFVHRLTDNRSRLFWTVLLSHVRRFQSTGSHVITIHLFLFGWLENCFLVCHLCVHCHYFSIKLDARARARSFTRTLIYILHHLHAFDCNNNKHINNF